MGLPILLTPLLSAIFRHKYCSLLFDALLVAVVLVYLPLLRDGPLLLKKVPPVAEPFSTRSMAAADAEHLGRRRAPFRHH